MDSFEHFVQVWGNGVIFSVVLLGYYALYKQLTFQQKTLETQKDTLTAMDKRLKTSEEFIAFYKDAATGLTEMVEVENQFNARLRQKIKDEATELAKQDTSNAELLTKIIRSILGRSLETGDIKNYYEYQRRKKHLQSETVNQLLEMGAERHALENANEKLSEHKREILLRIKTKGEEK